MRVQCLFAIVAVLALFALLQAQAPTDNPVASYYSGDQGYPAWTDRIAWGNVIDMSTYTNGTSAFQKFENARDQLASQGGGVLYYPAGVYDFSSMPADGPAGRGLMLKKGVVIRGATPTGDKDATDGAMALLTKFTFGFQTKGGGQVPRDWNFVGLMPSTGESVKDVNDVGVAWIEFTGAAVYFGFDANWGATWATAGSWKSSKSKASWTGRVPNGTHPWDPFAGGGSTYGGAGSGRLVFGCVFKDACVLNDAIDEGFGASGFWMYRFGPRIGVYGDRVLVANTVIPQSAKNFAYTQTTSGGSKTILFDYALTPGIDVNKCLLGWVRDNGNCTGYYEPGVVVRDNFVFNHGNKGYEIAGEWVTIVNCRNDRTYLQEGAAVYGQTSGWELTMDGYNEAGGAADNLSRAFDLGGRSLWVDHCWFTNTGSDPGNDGEGILCQFHGGTLLYSWALTRNTHVRGSGEPGYMGGYDVCHYGYFAGWNTTPGYVGSMNNKTCGLWDFSTVQNTAGSGILTSAAAGQTADTLTTCPGSAPAAPTNVSASVLDNDRVMVTWQDNASNEVAFRVDRRIGTGAWTAIAYRPRRSAGTTHNAQAWADFTAPSGRQLNYRVAAIDCNDNDAGASAATAPVTITGGATTRDARRATPASPATTPRVCVLSAVLLVSGMQPGPGRLAVVDLCGRTVRSARVMFGAAPATISIAALDGVFVLRVQRQDGFDSNLTFSTRRMP